MYANQSSSSYVKIYPNKDAIVQMKLMKQCCNTLSDTAKSPKTQAIHAESERALSDTGKASDECLSDDFCLVLILLLLLCSEKDDTAVFTLIMSTLFLF